ncbi:MAG: glutaredoxin family protein [Ottowia sp.]|nr:glutaredoxin family protein [Ottowia sp.]
MKTTLHALTIALALGAGAAYAQNNVQLPYELNQARQKYPVTIYTGKDCSLCVSARGLLTRRGVPFTEKTVTTKEDLQELQKRFNEGGIPIVTIGGQTIRGFEEGEWNSYLDAAGYPKTSALPANWSNPAPEPLVAPAETAAAPAAAGADANIEIAPDVPSGPPASVEPEKTPTNPTGIRF